MAFLPLKAPFTHTKLVVAARMRILEEEPELPRSLQTRTHPTFENSEYLIAWSFHA